MGKDYLQEVPVLPWNETAIRSGDPTAIVDYLYSLNRELTGLLEQIFERLNEGAEDTGMTWTYFATPNPLTGQYAEGSWRVGVEDGNFVKQRVVSGTWTTITMDY